MKTAKELLLGYLENINDADATIDLFEDNAAIELPYLASLDKQWRWEGRDVLYNFIKSFTKGYENFAFKNIQILIDTPEQVFAEYQVESIFKRQGKYIIRLIWEGLLPKTARSNY